MRCPSAKSLLATFRNLTPEHAKLIRKLARLADEPVKLEALIVDECTNTDRHLFGDPYRTATWRRNIMLRAIDELLGTHGVEPLGPVDMHAGPPYSYCNTGDSYAVTVVYERKGDRLILASWGDLAERHEANWASASPSF